MTMNRFFNIEEDKFLELIKNYEEKPKQYKKELVNSLETHIKILKIIFNHNITERKSLERTISLYTDTDFKISADRYRAIDIKFESSVELLIKEALKNNMLGYDNRSIENIGDFQDITDLGFKYGGLWKLIERGDEILKDFPNEIDEIKKEIESYHVVSLITDLIKKIHTKYRYKIKLKVKVKIHRSRELDELIESNNLNDKYNIRKIANSYKTEIKTKYQINIINILNDIKNKSEKDYQKIYKRKYLIEKLLQLTEKEQVEFSFYFNMFENHISETQFNLEQLIEMLDSLFEGIENRYFSSSVKVKQVKKSVKESNNNSDEDIFDELNTMFGNKEDKKTSSLEEHLIRKTFFGALFGGLIGSILGVVGVIGVIGVLTIF